MVYGKAIFSIWKILLIFLTIVYVFSALVVFQSSARVVPKATSAVEETTLPTNDFLPDEENFASVASVGDSVTVTATAYPEGVRQEFTWTLTLDEEKNSTFLFNRVKEKLDAGTVYISLTTTANTATVTALEYFKWGIKYTTYWKLTATSVENPELSATCSIQLG